MKRLNISSGTKWENVVGYSRAVRIGNTVEIAGTTTIEKGKVVGLNDAYTQTKVIIQKIEKVLIETGASLKDVVRTRIFVTDITRWKEVGKAHGEFFEDIKPVTTMIEIKSLIDPEMLVEIEVTAITNN